MEFLDVCFLIYGNQTDILFLCVRVCFFVYIGALPAGYCVLWQSFLFVVVPVFSFFGVILPHEVYHSLFESIVASRQSLSNCTVAFY